MARKDALEWKDGSPDYHQFACRHSTYGKPAPDAFYSTRVKDFEFAVYEARQALEDTQ